MIAPSPVHALRAFAPARLAPWLLVALALLPVFAYAQDAQPEEGGLGLDLSSPPPPAGEDFRPSLAVVGILPETEDEADVASAVASALAQATRKRNTFNPVVAPDQARSSLGDGYADAIKCAEASCLETLGNNLDVERLLLGRLGREGKRFKLELLVYARGLGTLERASVEGRTKNEVNRRARSALAPLLEKVADSLALLKLKTNLSGATVTLGERELGVGSMEKRVPTGTFTLKVAAPEYAPFEEEVRLAPGATLEVEATLRELPANRAPPQVVEALKPSSPEVGAKTSSRGGGVLTRPGLYVAVAGLAALGTGIALGLQVQAVAQRTRDANRDGLLDVTRAELLNAYNTAPYANGLMAAGGALTAGGALWFFLTPTPAPVAAPPPPSSEPSASRSPVPAGLRIGVGGAF